MKITENLTGLKNSSAQLEYLKKHYIIVGVIGEDFIDGVSVKDYAIYNEYGTLRIPSRPFFRTAVDTQQARNDIKNYMKMQLQEIISRTKTGEQALNSIGLYIVGKIKNNIVNGNFTPNSPKTIKIKGKDTVLRDTGTLLRNISFEIRRK